ncbi:MAG: PAS domain-containing protein [Loktanella sp.]|nr:PAS domain-containing protein [Loktanella sp.]
MAAPIDGIIWQADAATLRFHLVEGNVTGILGYRAEDWLAAEDFWQAHLHPEDAEATIARLADIGQKAGPHRLIYRMFAANGRIVWVQDNISVFEQAGQVILSGVMIDVTMLVTQRNQIHTASQRNAHYRSLYNLVPVAIWEEDWPDVLVELRNLHVQGVCDIHDHAQ